ncbi:putative late blight resistance protein homolog R1A-10 isoform X2 [Salvia miltiorrhiza]|nr:putative late blight resistance protein homolog R1A-10 isoform X2 [Salvia miltiorrhiza]
MDLKTLESKNSLSAGFLNSVENVMVGFDDELMQIKDRLTGAPSYKLDVISIVGMGGSGKTTLARNIYDDEFIVYHFYIRAWVTVSQEYDVREILLALLKSTEKKLTSNFYEDSIDRLEEYLYKSLKGSRYLIVLDDMWERDIWDYIKQLCPDDGNGSRIVVTSRISDMALYASSNNPPYFMRFLNKDESWNLLKRRVFKDEDCPSELERVGYEIAQSCQGLPLAIALVGGLLTKVQRSLGPWRSVVENIKSVMATEVDPCLELLSLSYNHLPHHLKMCFLYMGVFREDYQIPVSRLIWLWEAGGFLKPRVDGTSLVEVGEKCLKDLVDRSIVLVGKRTSSGKIKTCFLHDLVRDLCLREARKEKFLRSLTNNDDLISSEGAFGHRHLTIDSNILRDNASFRRDSMISVCKYSDGRLKEIYDALRSSSLIHSLMFTGTYHKPMNIYLGFRLLRVLDALHLAFLWFPIDVLGLVNLRYFALTFNGELPAPISNLRYLSILIVNQNLLGPPSYLPAGFWEMPQLRHIKFKEVYLPDYPDLLLYGRKTSFLDSLETLSGVRDFRITEDVFRSIPNVRKLGIVYDRSSNTEEWSFYCLHNLVYLHQLEKFACTFHSAKKHLSLKKPGLPGLDFPSNLKKLALRGWEISAEYMAAIASLHNLEILKLQSCSLEESEWNILEGEYGRLKVLLLEKVNLVRWGDETDCFPNLEHLIIKYCDKLEEIPSTFGDIPTLRLIKLAGCSSSCNDSANQILQDQQSLGNDDLTVSITILRPSGQ